MKLVKHNPDNGAKMPGTPWLTSTPNPITRCTLTPTS